jgi:hypothetical protein
LMLSANEACELGDTGVANPLYTRVAVLGEVLLLTLVTALLAGY